MCIIPVIDLQDGRVVRGVAGERARYRPVESRWVSAPTPAAVARVWSDVYGFQRVYVADLDAIAGGKPNWSALADIARAGLRLLVDAGTGDAQRARLLLRGDLDRTCLDAIIVSLESLADASRLPELLEMVGPEQALFSIDLRHGTPLTRLARWRLRKVPQIAESVVKSGFQRLITLDLACVGTANGPGLADTCRAIRVDHPDVELISGGGVRDMADVRSLLAAGCNGILVASALHDGRIRPGELRR